MDEKTNSLTSSAESSTQECEAILKLLHDLGEREKELKCLYGISELMSIAEISLPEILHGIVALIPPAWQYPDHVGARLTLEGQSFSTPGFTESPWRQASAIISQNALVGKIDVCFKEEPPAGAEKPFLDEEVNLLNAISERVGKIIERKRNEEALRNSETRFRMLFEHNADGLLVVDLGTKEIKLANSKMGEMLGYTKDELLRMKVNDLHPLPELPATMDEFEGPAEKERLAARDMACVRKDGTVFFANIARAEMEIDGRACSMNMFRDITECKKAEEYRAKSEEHTRQAQKLKSLNVLAGGVAHDFDNLLERIFGYIEMARDRLSRNNPDQAWNALTEAYSAFDQARALIKKLLTFAQEERLNRKLVALAPVIKSSAEFSLSGSNVTCQFDIADGMWSCECDENEIGQAIDNIVINARQAMPDGGKLTIAAENKTLKQDPASPQQHHGNYVRISFHDEGIGIPAENRAHIFDPFFTTRSKKQGLGLPIAYSICSRHGGWIDIDSEPGKGTTVAVFLPAAPPAALQEQ
jgi:PAS domain S-box-containing protein